MHSGAGASGSMERTVTRGIVLCLALIATGGAVGAESKGGSEVDLEVVHRIKTEAFDGSQVMDTLFWLTDLNGPRLTNSPGYFAAADWAVRKMGEWKLANPHLEAWGEFGRGWSSSRYGVQLVAPVQAPLSAVPKAWCAPTRGPVRAEVVLAPLFTRQEESDQRDPKLLEARIAAYSEQQRGRLRGKVVMIEEPFQLKPATEAPAKRLEAAGLSSLQEAPTPTKAPPFVWPITSVPADPEKRRILFDHLPLEVLRDFSLRMRQIRSGFRAFLRDEGVAGVLSVDTRGTGGIIFTEAGGPWEKDAPIPPASFVLVPEHYNRLARLLEHDLKVEVELELEAQFHDTPGLGSNVIAEIPGGAKKNEVVMLGAHLDSWHAGTGATDNAAGVAVVLEAVRILKTLGLSMDRTVRVALWGGEEQGLLGSRGYVRQHFGDSVTMTLTPEHARLSAYFNLDNGTGKIRGIHLQGNEMARPIFESWLAPFKDLGATTVTIRDTGGTDHQYFDAIGLPGFQFIQDPMDYFTRTHHSDLDVYDHAEPADLMQASAILASFVYNAANRPALIPRKPLPKPLPPRTDPPAR